MGVELLDQNKNGKKSCDNDPLSLNNKYVYIAKLNLIILGMAKRCGPCCKKIEPIFSTCLNVISRGWGVHHFGLAQDDFFGASERDLTGLRCDISV